MAGEDILGKIAESAGGAFRFGRGIVSRSSVVVLVFMVAVVVAEYGLRDDYLRLAALGMAAVVFFVWHFASLRFTAKHPDIALLDGAEWTAWKRWEMTAKGLPAPPSGPAISNPDLPLIAPDDDQGERD